MTYRVKFFISLCICASILANCAWSDPISGKYTAIGNSSSYQISYDHKKRRFGVQRGDVIQISKNHEIEGLSYCVLTDPIHIIWPKSPTLGFKKNLDEFGLEISIDGLHEEIKLGEQFYTGIYELSVLRKRLVVSKGKVIDRDRSDIIYVLYFSPERGLIAFTKKIEGKKNFLYVKEHD